MKRKIIHMDMDAFFAAIEERDNPELRGKPVIIGTLPGSRGVVSTCNYIARKYGVHSAMSTTEAYRLCPNGVFVPSNMKKYKEASDIIHKIMSKYTDQIEFVALDEGYMDVTGSELLFGNAEKIAKEIQGRVFEQVGTTCSVGVGYCKMAAKFASEEKKPNGFFVVEDAEKFQKLIIDRPVGILYGAGKKMQEKLNAIGIFTVKDLLNAPEYRLKGLGNMAQELLLYAKGVDNRPVSKEVKSKSIGKETTFQKDTNDIEFLKNALIRLASEVSYQLEMADIWCKTVTLKIKYHDMKSITRASTRKTVRSVRDIYKIAVDLLVGNWSQKKVRLIGITANNLTKEECEQISFSNEERRESDKKLDKAVQDLHKKYGKNIIKTAKEISTKKV
ncbi:MAG: DNA polymerase IV [Oscillospiraceae bacterium]